MAAPTLSPGDILGHFRLIEEIGAGGFGIVYRARDERLLRDVAVKVLNPKTLVDESARRRFRHEALMLGRLNHPNVEAVYDFHSEQGLDYLVLEYVPGTSLDSRLQGGYLPENEVISVGIQLARGLAAAHAQGVIHRDLKPGNLRINRDSVLKILDFGLAQLFAMSDGDGTVETAAIALEAPSSAGTLAYMAPEQLEGREPDTRCDIYSAGAVLYELATGSKPFPQRGQMLWDAILHSLPTAPRIRKAEISLALERVILKCLERDPKKRYPSATELLDDLSAASTAEALTESTWPRSFLKPAAKARRRRMSFIAVAILLLGIAVGYFVKRWSSRPEPQRIMAVLPFDSVDQDAATNALGLGLTETLTAKLVQASNNDMIQVVSPRELRTRGVKTAEDARREFGTDLVLEGSLQQSGQMYRITCNLVDSKTQRQIAARTITAEAGDMFGLQDKVVSETLNMLPARIEPEQRQSLFARRDTQPAAYEAYIRGRGYLQEYDKPENIDNAIAEFRRALKTDSNYALAYAALGTAYWTGFEQFSRGNDWVVSASQNCERALSLNPELAEGHVCLGNVLNGSGRYDKAVEEFKRAVELNGESEEAWRGLADVYTNLGNLSAAESTYKKAISLRPNYWGVYSWLGLFYYRQARYSDATSMLLKASQLAPDNYHLYFTLGGAYVTEGRYQEAIDAFQRSIDLRPSAGAYNNLGYAYTLMHRFPEAVKALEQGLKINDNEWMSWGNLGDALYWSPEWRAQAAPKYQQAISIALSRLQVNLRDAETLAYLADYSAMVGDMQGALVYLQRALDLAPTNGEVLFRAAIVYNHFDQRDQALGYLKKALDAGYSRTIIRDTPDFQSLQHTSQFRALMG